MSLQQLPAPPLGYETRMPRFEEERALVIVGRDVFGRGASLVIGAADAWHAMRRAAERDRVQLLLVSAFRGVARQAEIVARKLERGIPFEDILRVSAYPGFSEHHTGRAVDIGSPDCKHLTDAFADTREFAWLTQHAGTYRFSLSYPRGNPHGIAYEPWHWCWHGSGQQVES